MESPDFSREIEEIGRLVTGLLDKKSLRTSHPDASEHRERGIRRLFFSAAGLRGPALTACRAT